MDASMLSQIIIVLFMLESLVVSRPSIRYRRQMIQDDFQLEWLNGKLNVSTRRRIRLLSSKTQKYLQIKDKIVNGKADQNSKYARLSVESVGFGLIRIKGEETGRYLCFHPRTAKLILKKTGDNKYCVFQENLNELTFRNSFSSFVEKSWLIAIKNNGRMRLGNSTKNNTSMNNSTIEFLERKYKKNMHIGAARNNREHILNRKILDQK